MMKTRLTKGRIPVTCMQWLVESRIQCFHSMSAGKPISYLPAHLPVMSTWNEDQRFPVNMTVKGLGLIPKKKNLEYYTDIFESVIAEARSRPWNESLHKRVEVMMRLYSDLDNFDPTILGGLEIFQGKAFENLRAHPYASLLYVGMIHAQESMQYISFQVNSKVSILEKGDSCYRFLLAARKLFEFEKFHLYQPDYPFGYIMHVAEVFDKSPWSKKRDEQ